MQHCVGIELAFIQRQLMIFSLYLSQTKIVEARQNCLIEFPQSMFFSAKNRNIMYGMMLKIPLFLM